MVKTKKHI